MSPILGVLSISYYVLRILEFIRETWESVGEPTAEVVVFARRDARGSDV